ncbi:MAG: 1-acyl-sn-glycerol-3-phosphate acyltransferase [Dictyoglomaceae bacterium]|nr:1-acyl-sn-glycerol-3-phosphate acyltransferase [Dictyoglomaceae bacterium]
MRKKNSNSIFRIIIYKELTLFFRVLLKCLYKLEVKGLENIPKKGPAIIAPNHESSLDILVVTSVIPRLVKALGKIERFQYPIWGRVAKFLGGIPVTREHPEKSAIIKVFKALDEGNILVIFPEGTRKIINKIKGPRRGIGYFASRRNVPVIPTAIIGAYKIWPPEKRLPHLKGRLRVVFGNPIYYGFQKTRDDEEKFTNLIMEYIKTIKENYEEKNI